MKIGLAADHRGYKLKEKLKLYLQEKGIEIVDVGTSNFDRVDYPSIAKSLCEKVLSKEADYGIAICGTGIGMSIACNKVKGIFCGKISSIKEAKLCKKHNNCNIIALSGTLNSFKAKMMVKKYLKEDFSNEESYSRRIKQLEEIEDNFNER